MAEYLKLSILSPVRGLAKDLEVKSITLTGSEGQIQVLPGHVPMVGVLETGEFTYESRQGEKVGGFISTGFFEVREDTVHVMGETIELEAEIDVARAKAAQQKAESMLHEAGLDEKTFRKYELKLQRAIIRQGIGHRRGPS